MTLNEEEELVIPVRYKIYHNGKYMFWDEPDLRDKYQDILKLAFSDTSNDTLELAYSLIYCPVHPLLHTSPTRGVMMIGLVRIGNQDMITDVNKCTLLYDIKYLEPYIDKLNSQYLKVISAVDAARFKCTLLDAYIVEVKKKCEIWKKGLCRLRECNDVEKFMSEVKRLKMLVDDNQLLFPINEYSGFVFTNAPEFLHAIKLMQLYYRLNDDCSEVDELKEEHWYKLKTAYSPKYEYKEYMGSTLRGANLLYLEIVDMWLKLNGNYYGRNKLPDELKILFSKE